MCDGIVSSFEPAATFESVKMELADNEALLIKIDIGKYDIEEARSIYNSIVKEFPHNKCIGIPSGVELSVEIIDDLISTLEAMKK